jgi:hypothetical protein
MSDWFFSPIFWSITTRSWDYYMLCEAGTKLFSEQLFYDKSQKRYLANRNKYFHTQLLPPPPGYVTDHVNRNSRDNRLSNLRLATRSQNMANKSKSANTASKYFGVTKSRTGWRAQTTVNYKTVNLGYFDTERDAALAYDQAARKLHGGFAHLNFPDITVYNIKKRNRKRSSEYKYLWYDDSRSRWVIDCKDKHRRRLFFQRFVSKQDALAALEQKMLRFFNTPAILVSGGK